MCSIPTKVVIVVKVVFLFLYAFFISGITEISSTTKPLIITGHIITGQHKHTSDAKAINDHRPYDQF